MRIRWNTEVPGAAAHCTAVSTYLLVVGIVPVMLMALLGLVQAGVWVIAGTPHPWGHFHCLWSYVVPAIPWIIGTSIVGCLFFVISTILAIVRRWIRFSFWTPLILAFPVALAVIRRPYTGGGFLALLASVGFCVYWLAFSRHDVIAACPKRQLIRRSATALLVFVVLISVAFLGSYWKAKRLVDADLARHGQSAYCIRASFVLDFYPGGMLDMFRPCWVFRYNGLARIYVSIPDYEVFQSGWALDPMPLFGVLP